MKLHRVFASLAALALAVSLPARAEDEPVAVRIDVADRATPVSPYLYGMFIEPIRNLVGRSLWAELLDDRKFYYPVLPTSRDPEAPPSANGPPGLGSRKWRPVGGDDAVAMDRANPFVGAHSPRVAVGRVPRGLTQSGIGIAKGRRYEGSVWLSGDPGTRVQVALVWGDRPSERETIVLSAPGAEWRKAEFAFTGLAATLDARFEITGTGTGAFRVASPSLMPDDNINGWRADTTALARSLNSRMWRLPGGNFLSNWDWHEALGDRDRRNPMFDHAWDAVQSNDLGMDE